jgi:hypothetical protein
VHVCQNYDHVCQNYVRVCENYVRVCQNYVHVCLSALCLAAWLAPFCCCRGPGNYVHVCEFCAFEIICAVDMHLCMSDCICLYMYV